jgi:maltooligosyltrehalose trehalohydrolase
MGEEYGETHPFLYFVSHGDPALAEAVRAGRRREFASFGWGDEIPDPAAEETFRRSKLDRAEVNAAEHRLLLTLHRDLLALRREERALHPGAAAVEVRSNAKAGWLAVELSPGEGPMLFALFNFSDREHAVPVPRNDGDGHWRIRFSSRNARYGGPSDTPRAARRHASGERRIKLLPWSAALYRHEEH